MFIISDLVLLVITVVISVAADSLQEEECKNYCLKSSIDGIERGESCLNEISGKICNDSVYRCIEKCRRIICNENEDCHRSNENGINVNIKLAFIGKQGLDLNTHQNVQSSGGSSIREQQYNINQVKGLPKSLLLTNSEYTISLLSYKLKNVQKREIEPLLPKNYNTQPIHFPTKLYSFPQFSVPTLSDIVKLLNYLNANYTPSFPREAVTKEYKYLYVGNNTKTNLWDLPAGSYTIKDGAPVLKNSSKA